MSSAPAPKWVRRAAVALAIVTALCLLPMAAVLLSTGLARLGHCTLNEAAVHPCMIAGHDIGSFLASLFVLGWLMLITAPILNLAVTAWIMLGVIMLARRFAPPQRRWIVTALAALTVICLEPVIAMLPSLVFAVFTGADATALLWTVHAYAQRLRSAAPLMLVPVLAWAAFGVTYLIRRPPG